MRFDLQSWVHFSASPRHRSCADSPSRCATRRFAPFALLAVLLLGAHGVQASAIRYELVDLGADRYRYVYSVTNDGSLVEALRGFDLFFDPDLYLESSLAITTPSASGAGWDELILGSGVLVPATYDVIALAGGISEWATHSGFAVDFIWTGIGLPGAQPFEIFDPQTLLVLESGMTTPIPEPSSLALLALGSAMFAARRSARHR